MVLFGDKDIEKRMHLIIRLYKIKFNKFIVNYCVQTVGILMKPEDLNNLPWELNLVNLISNLNF